MNLTKQTFELLLTTWSNLAEEEKAKTPLASYIADSCRQIEQINNQRKTIELSIDNVKTQAGKSIIELKNELDKVRERCKHQETRYHPDAAGGSDSWTECLICGKEI